MESFPKALNKFTLGVASIIGDIERDFNSTTSLIPGVRQLLKQGRRKGSNGIIKGDGNKLRNILSFQYVCERGSREGKAFRLEKNERDER